MIIQKPVKNFAKSRGTYRPEMIVIHIGEGTAQQIYQTFQDEEKSSHYLICKNQEIWQFVKEEDTAWHCGIKIRPKAKLVLEKPDINPNLFSVGIENEGIRNDIISDDQYNDNAELVLAISKRWLIPLDRDHVIGHNEIRADKECPLPISVDRILKLAIQKNIPDEVKIEELKKVEIGLLQRILSILREQLQKLLTNFKK